MYVAYEVPCEKSYSPVTNFNFWAKNRVKGEYNFIKSTTPKRKLDFCNRRV